ncbi:hypothetical protein PFAG_04883 [Plasmodium falciparum Santa Lucia]|uniref:Phosphoinositide phosphatase SAC1 n=8 Tax=Plasmodium falciparum TaxID=5833 RepID=Q8IDF9_PLAF7|nr:phosphoinositide phosphatase SAC1 [Plasmodium falciparum 3D7]ETW28316.1 hypothetical protein PFFCH_04225 [Plasmodium falciparum FCH/4]ETW55693.1 hypothetical protein PFUGPA_02455 [Plasmodium falciparum Palo Alto/Uganda]ETW59302.1 hypothetical protein PFMC_04778 [Plasmodium falciparum CAMP/Malaysia]EUT80242.1 hypothetical protein PFAG_04883 [Plasmodium falciparum Santa Lucia]EWC74419.1 hypothetical protein C923_04913 [Plasmodium falciparum UGT5.1]EWC91022.1 hypothetical protein PFNF54_00267|eukprot:XP_001350254.1 inositol-polyphosphate 5-phosphatase, putative [Plasmodium falciparum 3D7]
MTNYSKIPLKKYYLESHGKYLCIVNVENNVKNILKINYSENINITKEQECITSKNTIIENDNKNKFWFYGCLGIIKAENINFLVIVSEAEVVCNIFNRSIYRIKRISFVQLNCEKMNKNTNELYEYEICYLGSNGNLTSLNNIKKDENKKFFCNKNKIQTKNYFDNLFQSTNFLLENCVYKYNRFYYNETYIHKFKNCTLKEDVLKIITYFLHAFNKGPFYFSYYYNLTISLQNQYMNELDKKNDMNKKKKDYLKISEHASKKLNIYSNKNNNNDNNNNDNDNNDNDNNNNVNKIQFNEINDEYTWNWKILDTFKNVDAYGFVVFLIHGYINTNIFHVEDNKKISLYLISRKCKNRSGVRFWCRGSNENGDVANFVETEQIVVCKNKERINIFSYIIVRGSIPVLWKQQPTLSIRPAIHVCPNMSENKRILNLHMKKLQTNYGKISITNLINKKFGEKYLGECFENCLSDCNVEHNFTWFDFHSEFKKLNFENLDYMLEKVVSDLNKFSYFSFSIPIGNDKNLMNDYDVLNYNNFHFNLWQEAQIYSHQNGVFRVNCIDCLDRTNVFQSFLSKYVLYLQLKSVDIKLQQRDNFPFYFFHNKYDEISYRRIWINNANAISLIYSGAGALKNDITQNGKRTISGLFNDLYCIIVRYVNNNFLDGYNNDCINMAINEKIKFIHNFNINKGNNNPLIQVLVEFIIIFSTAICTSPVQNFIKSIYFCSHNCTISMFSRSINYIFLLLKNNFNLFLFPYNHAKYLSFISFLAKTSGVLSTSLLIFLFFCVYVFTQRRRVISSPKLDANS